MVVLRRLQALGVNPERLAAEGYGEYSPFADNSTAAGRAENRKVVIAVSKLSSKPTMSEADAPSQAIDAQQTPDNISVQQATDAAQTGQVEVSADGTIKVIQLPHGGIKITSAADTPPPAQQKRDN
jgi:chemotaxis protein MotB